MVLSYASQGRFPAFGGGEDEEMEGGIGTEGGGTPPLHEYLV